MYIVPWRGPVPGAGLRRGVADRVGELDPDELIYLINRYYDPASGQFLSVDPDVAQTQQPYAYVAGDPVNDTDPTGDCTPASDLPCPTGSPVAAESPSGAGGDGGSSTEDRIERLGKYLEEGIWKYWSVVNADHFAAVMASVNNIVEQLVGFGYSVGEIKKGMVRRRKQKRSIMPRKSALTPDSDSRLSALRNSRQ